MGFDIAGPEHGNPPRLFQSAYEIARLGQLGLTVHAGEDAPAEYVWEAVDELGATRIGHGCSAASDPELLRRLARDRILVECCLSSNYHTGAVKRGAPHPIHAFLEAGVPVAICCDNTTVSRTDAVRETLLAPRRRWGSRRWRRSIAPPTLSLHPARDGARRDGRLTHG